MNSMLLNDNQTKTTTEIHFSTHSIIRCQQRALSNWAIEQAILKGEKIYKQGNTFHYLKRKFIINHYPPHQHKQLFDLVVLMAEDKTIITAYKNPDAIAHIKRKPKRLAKCKNSFVISEVTSSNQLDKINTQLLAA